MFLERSSFGLTDRAEHGETRAWRVGQHALDDILGGVFLHLRATDGAECSSYAGIEEAQILVDFGAGAYGRTGVTRNDFLLDGDGWGYA